MNKNAKTKHTAKLYAQTNKYINAKTKTNTSTAMNFIHIQGANHANLIKHYCQRHYKITKEKMSIQIEQGTYRMKSLPPPQASELINSIMFMYSSMFSEYSE